MSASPPSGARDLVRSGPRAHDAAKADVARGGVDRLGPFVEDRVGDWIRWWSRARALDVAERYVPEVLLRRRIHGANNSRRYAADHDDVLLEIARAHLRNVRRRSGNGTDGDGPV